MTSPENRFMIQLMNKLLAVVFACMVLVLSSCDGQLPDRPGSDGKPVDMRWEQFDQFYNMQTAASAGIFDAGSSWMSQTVKPEMRADYESQQNAIFEEYSATTNALRKQLTDGTISETAYYEGIQQAELQKNEQQMRLAVEWWPKDAWSDLVGLFWLSNSSSRPRTIRLAIWTGNVYQGTGSAYFSQTIELPPESDDTYTVTIDMGGKYAGSFFSGIEIVE